MKLLIILISFVYSLKVLASAGCRMQAGSVCSLHSDPSVCMRWQRNSVRVVF